MNMENVYENEWDNLLSMFNIETYIEDYSQHPTFYPEPSYPEPSTSLTIQHDNTRNDQTPTSLKPSLSRSYPKNIKSITAPPSIVRTGDMKPEFCVICGGKTKCYHYDVPSCNACKTFFRRSISTKKFYTCKFNRKCDYNAGDHCPSCRFDRCLMLGMNPEALVLPKTLDFEKFQMKIVKRKRILQDQNQAILSKIRPTFEQTVYNKEIDGLVYLEFKLRRLRESSYNPTLEQGDIRSILQRPSELRNSDRYEKPRDWPINMEVYQQKFKLWMMNRIKGLFDDNVEKRNWLTVDLILVIEAAKTLPAFGMLDEEDKIVLLEYIGLANTILLECFYSVEKSSSTIVMPNGLVPIQMQKPGSSEMHHLRSEAFCRCIEPLQRVGLDLVEYVLLKAVIYSYSCIPGLSRRGEKILSKEREKYALILLRYVQAKLGDTQGAKKYAEVIALMETFYYFGQRHHQLQIVMNSIVYPFKPPLPPFLEKILYK